MAGWQTRPVFVSSTFRDMQSERDWLRERVFSELEERLRQRRAHCEATLQISQRLADKDPGNAKWQRDLAVAHSRMGYFLDQSGNTGEAMRHLRQCGEILRAMQARGMHLDPQAERALAKLEEMGL